MISNKTIRNLRKTCKCENVIELDDGVKVCTNCTKVLK